VSYLDDAADAIRDIEKELENSGYRDKYQGEWREQRGKIVEQWLKLAAIEKGINPWASSSEAGEPS
jgi:hypothetical protein